jgi:hypothetical protein
MKYEIIARATTDWAYIVEAESPEQAKEILGKAIDEGEGEEFIVPEPHDFGEMEIISEPKLLV